MKCFIPLLFIICSSIANAALFNPKEGVTNLDIRSFNSRVLKDESSTSIVAFTAPWCGHCKNLAPQFTRAAKSLDNLVSFYNVDCDNDNNKSLCSKYGVRGFPTIKSFNRGSKLPPKDYNGERTSKAISEWAGNQIRNVVNRLSTNEDIQNWLNKKKSNYNILVYTNKATTSTLLKSLALKFNKFGFGIMKETSRNKDVKEVLDICDKQLPVVIAIKDGDLSNHIIYDGSLKFKYLSEWLDSLSNHLKDEL